MQKGLKYERGKWSKTTMLHNFLSYPFALPPLNSSGALFICVRMIWKERAWWANSCDTEH